ncbi:MAG: PAS domain S-box protein, partial [Gemmatimonadales bacterium]
KIILVNREVERLFGYAREELLGKSVDLLVPERYRGAHGGFRQGFLASPKVRSMGVGRELFGIRKDGVEVPVEIGLTPVATEEGLFVLSSIVDISARKRAEERFRIAVESSPNGMVMIDASGTMVLVNREVERMFGYSRAELMGQTIEKLVPARFRESHPDWRTTFFRDPHTRAMGMGRDLRGLRKDGTEIPVEIGLNPIETDEGVFVLGSIVDISARKLAEQERHTLEEQLRQAQKMEAVGTLAGGIAHDFNNLLGAIVGYAELIADTVEGEEVHGDIRELLKAADRGRLLVDHILAFSRRQEIIRRPLSLGQVAEEVTKMLRATIPAAVEIRLQVHPEVPRVLADATSIHQVLMNLGTNAAHAMPAGGTMSIQIEPFYVRDSIARGRSDLHEGPYALLMVSDTGVGMDRVTRSRVFEPFFTTKAPGTGTGLGLAVVHGIMRDHEGAVDLESEPGQGTTVRCFFPSLTVEMDERPEGPRIAPRGKGERILFVEDEPALAQVGARRLVRLGYQVAIETDSTHALEMLRARQDDFDLLITDFSMPRLNGVQLAQALREIAPDLAIILITGNLEGLSPAETASAGIGLVLQKPATVQQLGEAVRTLLGARVRG